MSYNLYIRAKYCSEGLDFLVAAHDRDTIETNSHPSTTNDCRSQEVYQRF